MNPSNATKSPQNPLPPRGVEVLNLPKHNHTDAASHLHFPARNPRANTQRRNNVTLPYH